MPGDGSTILMTADADRWPIHLEQHIPANFSGGIYIFDYKVFGKQRWPGTDRSEEHAHYPLNTIAMNATLWREIMGIFLKILNSRHKK